MKQSEEAPLRRPGEKPVNARRRRALWRLEQNMNSGVEYFERPAVKGRIEKEMATLKQRIK
jgi:hypothetical protein